MATTNTTDQAATRRRGIGILGTAARAVVGSLLLGSVAWGHLQRGFHPTRGCSACWASPRGTAASQLASRSNSAKKS